MEYRINKRTGDKISVIGFGAGYIGEGDKKTMTDTITYAVEHGINYFDFAAYNSNSFEIFGNVIGNGPLREKIKYQIHFGADYTGGKYGWTTDLETIKKSVAVQLAAMKTDYIDYGFIHCIDELTDYEKYKTNGVIDYILELKEKGVVRHIGLSTHTPVVANRVLDEDIIDMLMFSINPAYDYKQGDYGIGSSDERMALYRRCEAMGVGISVMKAFGGGQLLNEDTSPFKKSLTKTQCIRYALDKPGVMTVLPGFGTVKQVADVLEYLTATEEEKDYSVISTFTPAEAVGVCVYCNHCAPCPVGLDVALISKYYDLYNAGDEMAKEHYLTLEKTAEDCIGCGHCNSRCPFKVDRMSRMQKIAEDMGK